MIAAVKEAPNHLSHTSMVVLSWLAAPAASWTLIAVDLHSGGACERLHYDDVWGEILTPDLNLELLCSPIWVRKRSLRINLRPDQRNTSNFEITTHLTTIESMSSYHNPSTWPANALTLTIVMSCKRPPPQKKNKKNRTEGKKKKQLQPISNFSSNRVEPG
jgi:hypothetical protein